MERSKRLYFDSILSTICFITPNEHTRVGYLLEGIQCPDPGLQAAMVSIRTDDGPDSTRNNFETMATHILPYDPVSKKQAATAASTAEDMDVFTSTTTKESVGKTGVHL